MKHTGGAYDAFDNFREYANRSRRGAPTAVVLAVRFVNAGFLLGPGVPAVVCPYVSPDMRVYDSGVVVTVGAVPGATYFK